MIKFILNDKNIQTDLLPGTTVLDFVRYHKHLTGTKIGCREGDCGACTVLVGNLKGDKLSYQSMTSCLMPLANAHGKHIVTVEGINREDLTPVQNAIVEEGGTQCGFCTVGFVVSLTGFSLSEKPHTYQNAIAAIDGNICRCTGYKSLERAALQISKLLEEKNENISIPWLVKKQFVPSYFGAIQSRLENLQNEISMTTEPASDAVIVGGGTDLFVQRPEEMAKSSVLPFYDQPVLNAIDQKGDFVYLGASVTAEDIRSSSIMNQHFPELHAYMKLVSSTPIRNMGTIAGNLVNASPIGDLTIFFLALDSTLILNNKGTKRELKLRDFYKAYKTLDKAPEEYIEQIYFKVPGESSYFNFEKVCKRTHLDIASVNSAYQIKVVDEIIVEAHLSAGGVGPTPKYLSKSSAALIGNKVNAELIKKVAALIQEEISPISDARGSKTYKRLLLRQLYYAHFIKNFPEKLSIMQLS